MGVTEILGIILACAGGIIFYLGLRKTNESDTISKYVPADNISSIPFGVPVIASGTVIADQPLISPVTKKACVYFDYTLERETETKDNNGNVSWSWKRVGSPELQTIPFFLQDQKGKILIKPANCEVNGIYKTEQFLQPGTIQNVSTGLKMLADAFQFSVSDNQTKENRERVTENTILTGSTINVFGIATLEGEQKFIQKTNNYPLILSPLSKDQLVGSERKTAYIFYALAAALIVVALILFVKS